MEAALMSVAQPSESGRASGYSSVVCGYLELSNPSVQRRTLIVSSTAHTVAAGPILPKLLWQPTLNRPVRPEVPLIIPSTPLVTGPPHPNPTTVPICRGRPSKTTPPTLSQQQVIPPEAVVNQPGSTRSAVVNQPGSTRSGRQYLKS
ncbi:hypothetical protein OUZ56_033258 [Daphnia magna]|uniref:Uncharacterized protein n=1 Tax=Daphnia magna TaxID=35525 RepID=A0ABQ9ZXJ1_9CRUS|nr:hypothetical protein OUZ56_033258 [Daphnia magna]